MYLIYRDNELKHQGRKQSKIHKMWKVQDQPHSSHKKMCDIIMNATRYRTDGGGSCILSVAFIG